MKNKTEYYAKKFPDNRHEGKSMLEKIQIVQLRMLKIFDDICKRHNLSYFVTCGTLLGAIRHKGFIPWDDDTDVIMPREDFDRFSKIVEKELPEDLFWQDIDTDNFPHFRMLLGKIRDNKSQMERGKEYNTGVFLDIYVIEKISEHPETSRMQKKYLDFLCHLDLLKNHKSFMQQIRVRKMISGNIILRWIVSYSALILGTILKKTDIPGILRGIYYKKINKKNYLYYWYYGKSFLFERKDIFPVKRVIFEDAKVNSPNNPDKILTELFKDYKIFPKKEQRKPGHIIPEETTI